MNLKALKIAAILFGMLLAIASFLWLLPCHPPKLSLTIVEKNANEPPIFDFTTDEFYLNEGRVRKNRYTLGDLQVWQIDTKGDKLKCVWSIQPASPQASRYPNVVEYGKPPADWEELKKAEPLQNGRIYYLNDTKVFIKNKDGSFTVLPEEYLQPYQIAKRFENMKNIQ